MKKIIEGILNRHEVFDAWTFDSKDESFDGTVCEALDQLMGYTTKEGEKFRITIEKL